MSKTVLVVDDSSEIRILLRKVLMGSGYNVIEAANAYDAFDQIKKRGPVHLVVTDYDMPMMTGLEMAQQIRSTPDTNQIPILVLSSDGKASRVEEGKRIGIQGWMTKSFNPPKFLEVVGKIIGNVS